MRNGKSFCNVVNAFAFKSKISYFNNLFFRKFGLWEHFSTSGSSLESAVPHIVQVCSSKQMIRIAAGGIIAMMTNIQGFIELSMKPFVGQSMNKCAVLWTVEKRSVSLGVRGSIPNPAWTQFRFVFRYLTILVHLFPKTILNRTLFAFRITQMRAVLLDSICALESLAATLAFMFVQLFALRVVGGINQSFLRHVRAFQFKVQCLAGLIATTVRSAAIVPNPGPIAI